MTERPNIVLVITDHFRGDCLSRMGHPVAETPHLDSLSRQGVVFTQAYTLCPSCTPARRSLMTGQTPYTQGMVGYSTYILDGNNSNLDNLTPSWHNNCIFRSRWSAGATIRRFVGKEE